MEQKVTWQSIVIALLIFVSLPYLSRYSSTAAYFAEDYFSSFVYKIGDSGGLTSVFLSIFCEVLALLISITIIVAIFIFPIWGGIMKTKKRLVAPLAPSVLLKYFFSIHAMGFFVSYSFFTIDTLKIMMS